MPHRRDAVDAAVRTSTRRVREPRPRRDAVVRHRFDQLFSLYTDVKENMNEWNLLQFAAIVEGMEDMTAAMDNFALRCKKMPGRYQCPKFKSCFNLGSLAV